ncbi:hypothetical protein L211DRAFT_841403 [Terfezia boudieri ATCC MYA-4762]|uniref:Uncharacterized protein n=1 Tax=Terfezia boudieri ATCC MYA-4762 TaxID=1051890 RepID=A0A3N4LGW2_9PEZI|nr:hypothetical protein L211DRAFT_841403 [Terfezia boudieri ATCC MYA-4762]
MIPRFLLSRGGVPMLQLQRLLVASPPRTSVLGIWRARISGGDNAIGRLSISPVAVRYGSSDAKDSKKAKKPKKKDSERKAKKTEEKSKKEKEKKEGEEREGGTSAANVEGSTAPDTVGGYRRALAEAVGPAAAATGVSAPEVETPKEESAPVAAEPSEPALEEVVVARADVPPSPTVAGSTAGPAAETTPAPAPEPPAGTTVPGAEGLEAAAAEPTTPGETSTRSSTAAELGELLKSESKSAEPQESKAEQESTAGDDANSHKSPEVVKVAPEDELELCPRSQEAVEKAGEPKVQPYTGPIDFYKLIASTPLPYANPHHLGRPMVASPPKGASSPPPPAPSPPPPPPPHSSPPPPLPPSSLSSSSSPPPKITEIHTSHSAPTAFPTATTAPNPQPITFASTRLNTSMASSEKSPLSSKAA